MSSRVAALKRLRVAHANPDIVSVDSDDAYTNDEEASTTHLVAATPLQRAPPRC